MKIKFTFLGFLAICGLAFSNGHLYAQTLPKKLTEAEWQLMIDRINLLVDNHFENRDYNEGEKANWNIAGLSVGVYHNGRTAFFSRGHHESQQRNRAANRKKVAEDSIFAIGSVSKPVSTIMLSYFSRINNPATGKPYLNLNDPVNKYFKTRPFIDTDGTAVHPTLMQFITHYSGAPSIISVSTPTLAQFKSELEDLKYTHKPGTNYSYSMGAAVVANIVASLYYQDFPERRVNDLLQELLFAPLGMKSTKLHGWDDPALKDRMTLGHRFNGAATGFRAVKRGDFGGASGCITSTAPDMMRLAAFIVGDGIPRGSEVLQQAAAAGLAWRTGNRSVPNTALSPHESNVPALGGRFRELFARPANPGRYGSYLYHGGAIGGHYTAMAICPDTKTAVVVLVNNQSALGSLYAQIMDSVLNATYSGQRTPADDFDDRLAPYARANANVDIALNENFTIGANNIGVPARKGATLTIRSANPARLVTLTRGATGELFTVPNGATLIFRDIIIDGGGNIITSEEDNMDEYDEEGNLLSKAPAALGGTLVRVNSGGTFIMESGAVLRNNVNSSNSGGGVRLNGGSFTMRGGSISGNSSANHSGGGVYLYGNSSFTMSGGEISGNTAVSNGGGLRFDGSAVFTMTGGKIHTNTASSSGGGVYATSTFTISGGEISGNTAGYGGGVYATSTFTMSGGQISGNTASNTNGVRITGSGVFNHNSGVVAGTGANRTAVISGTYNLNVASPNNALTIAWNRPAGALNYAAGSSTNLTVSPNTATAVWANQGGVLGISYANGRNTGWIRQW